MPRIELPLQQWMETFKVPGLSVAVFDRNELVWAKTYGVKQASALDPVTLDTLFQAGSISKPVTAMAALHFVESGKWTLDAEHQRQADLVEGAGQRVYEGAEGDVAPAAQSHRGHNRPRFPRLRGRPAGADRWSRVLDGEKPANTRAGARGYRSRDEGRGTAAAATTIVQLMMVDQL